MKIHKVVQELFKDDGWTDRHPMITKNHLEAKARVNSFKVNKQINQYFASEKNILLLFLEVIIGLRSDPWMLVR